MRKHKTSKRNKKPVDRSATTDVVTQLEIAIRRPHAALIGALVGAVVPWFARTLAHEELPAAWSGGNRALAAIMIAVVMGCAVFSALTVYKFGKATFGDVRKAVGFVLAMEGVMLISHGTTSTVALAVLIAINALANGATIAMSRDAAMRRREADERRAATRAATVRRVAQRLRCLRRNPRLRFRSRSRIAARQRRPRAHAHRARTRRSRPVSRWSAR